MEKRIIRICYRKIIDASATEEQEKLVFETTYSEFLLQSQFYNQGKKFSSFEEIIKHNPAAEKLHFLVSSGAITYLQQLNKIIPDIKDNLGNSFLPFSEYRFELIESGVKNKSAHKIAINFYSDSMVWLDTISEYLLVSKINTEQTKDGVLTNLLKIQPSLSIYSVKMIQHD